jgi:hypothetical protein
VVVVPSVVAVLVVAAGAATVEAGVPSSAATAVLLDVGAGGATCAVIGDPMLTG